MQREENRGPEVARAIGAYCGRLALTASAGHEIGGRHVPLTCSRAGMRQMRDDVATDILSTIADLNAAGVVTWSRSVTLGDIEAMSGRWFATARIVAVLNPARNIGPWASLGAIMSASRIEWCDHSINVVDGCSPPEFWIPGHGRGPWSQHMEGF